MRELTDRNHFLMIASGFGVAVALAFAAVRTFAGLELRVPQ